MKTTLFAVAAMAGAGSAVNHRHAHDMFAERGHAASTGFPVANSTCEMCIPGCTTTWKTVTGEATLVPVTVTIVTLTSTSTSTSTSTMTITYNAPTTAAPVPVQTTTVVVVPTPEVQRCPTPGTYTFQATTMTVTDITTVCGATSSKMPAGTHTVGGVTTVVTTQTTVTCPVATVVTTGSVTTSTICMTEYICPTAGTYTIGAHITACETETVIVYPTPTVIVPGTYTKPQVIVTATETDYVTVFLFTSSGLPTATPTASAVSTPVAFPSSSIATLSYSAPTSAAPSSDAPRNDGMGITYGPYDSNSGACKSASQVKKDIEAIKKAGFTFVRIYGTDCDTLVNVVPACVKQGLQVIAAIFVKSGQQCSINTPEVKKQVDDLIAMNNWAAIRILVVGNESIMNGICTAETLAQLLEDVKSRSAFKGPYTVAETLNIWQKDDVKAIMCDLVDVVGSNIHAGFNPDVEASDAGKFVKEQMDLLEHICHKSVINLETGWSNEGPCNGKACPSPENQKTAIASIKKECKEKNVVLFSYDNQRWKAPGDQNWGLADAIAELSL